MCYGSYCRWQGWRSGECTLEYEIKAKYQLVCENPQGENEEKELQEKLQSKEYQERVNDYLYRHNPSERLLKYIVEGE
jgi:hypothetical protein